MQLEDEEWAAFTAEMKNRVSTIISTCKALEDQEVLFMRNYEGNRRRLQKLTQRINFLV